MHSFFAPKVLQVFCENQEINLDNVKKLQEYLNKCYTLYFRIIEISIKKISTNIQLVTNDETLSHKLKTQNEK